MKFTISIAITLFIQVYNAQVVAQSWHVRKHIFNHPSEGYVTIEIDTIKGDTTKYFRNSNRYIELNKEGVKIVDGHTDGRGNNSCGTRHGYWIERYQNGVLKKQGRYLCDQKVGAWVFYHQNGQLMRVENYNQAYHGLFARYPRDGRTGFCKEGPFLEYYANGQLKTEGAYLIVEEFFSGLDTTIVTFHPDTYEELIKTEYVEYWRPVSKKTGHWYTYSEDGTLLTHQEYVVNTRDNDSMRHIETGFWEKYVERIEDNKKVQEEIDNREKNKEKQD